MPSAQLLNALAEFVRASIAEAFEQRRFGIFPRRQTSEILDRATARGELTTRPDPATLNALLVGPVFAWLFLLSESPDQLPALTATLLDATLALISPGLPAPEANPAANS
ncbi:TetR/AcrR family transcriptional regulator C-terminal ligand-binding domain-containing protein [Streptomyces sp. P9-2B-2]|uniref:TetR/AcrR family transcriptional regulator C-terminal ligand-binding domain-containing protein n=1 Tax=Streptomyces TaxID=1883 RepID=UPI002257F109|nr:MULTISPECIES: TetR/AcrR family transcriptional regulator C-terminal ligand-binding domain-containing protein [Streptomyces]MCX4638346.1 TetR/AcrR family transcriptional regulator C-terminal ligand-binding domain-containing protein [Streptomyces platensis]WJY37057.1 TetR/AcrR family transcriptional regulator C-terminal ligand-binding domain-containing protein [Streptomyces sp. P9-2B-2]